MQFHKENFIKYTAIVLLDSWQKGMLFNLKFSRTGVGYRKGVSYFCEQAESSFQRDRDNSNGLRTFDRYQRDISFN